MAGKVGEGKCDMSKEIRSTLGYPPLGGNARSVEFTQCSHSRWRYLQFQLALSQAVTCTLNSVVVKEGCSSKNMHESLGRSLVHNDMELGLRHCAAQLICYVYNKIYYWAVYHAVYM